MWWIKLGIYPELIEPGKPQQNGIHERMHGTLKAEATIPASASMKSQQQRFDEFRIQFNEVRPHEALGMKQPAEVYRRSERALPSEQGIYDYPAHYLVRRVSRAGAIRMQTKQIFVTTTLKEQYVGLEAVDDGVYDLFFCFYHIGRYGPSPNWWTRS